MNRYAVLIPCIILVGCAENEPNKNKIGNSKLADKESIPKINKDSVLGVLRSRSFKTQESFDFGYIQIKSIGSIKFSKEIRHSYEYGSYNTYFKYKKAERNEIFLSLTLDIISKQTPKEKGIDVMKYRDSYLPQVY